MPSLRTLVGGLAAPMRQAGDRARDRGAWSTAADHYRAHLQSNPTDFAIWVQLGHACKEAGDYPAAQQAYEKAIELQPTDFDVHLNKGHLEKLWGRNEDALASYRKALSLNPMDPSAARELLALGGYDSSLHAGPSAREAADTGAELPGRSPLASSAGLQDEIRKVRANVELRKARREVEAGRPETAVATYMRAFELNPADADVAREIVALKLIDSPSGAEATGSDQPISLTFEPLGVDQRTGWREETPKVRWLSGSRARMRFPTDLEPGCDIQLCLRAQAPSELSPEHAGIRVILGGRANAFASLKVDPDWLVARGKTDPDGGVSVDLECADSLGRRRSGVLLVGLSAMAFCATGDVLGRISILEKIRSADQAV